MTPSEPVFMSNSKHMQRGCQIIGISLVRHWMNDVNIASLDKMNISLFNQPLWVCQSAENNTLSAWLISH